jgi:hypothetical protein
LVVGEAVNRMPQSLLLPSLWKYTTNSRPEMIIEGVAPTPGYSLALPPRPPWYPCAPKMPCLVLSQ